MKKAYRHIIPGALAIVALTGCGNDGNEPEINERNRCPQFTATIGSQSRAYDTNWEKNDEIGISGSECSNVCYVTGEGDGKFTVKPESEPIYFQNDDKVSFSAYYPWYNLTDGTTEIKFDTEDQNKQKSFDFLWAVASGQSSQPSVKFDFVHKMAKLYITVNCGKGVSFDELKAASLSFSGFISSGSFNIADGIAHGNSSVDGPVEDWEFSEFAQFNDKDETYFSLILLPQKFEENGLELKANLNGDILQTCIDFTNANIGEDGPDAKNEWVAGRQYNLSLKLHKTAVTVESNTITSWLSLDDIYIDVN